MCFCFCVSVFYRLEIIIFPKTCQCCSSMKPQETNTRSSRQGCSMKKVFLEILQNSQENTCARVSFLIKLQTSACNFIEKQALAQVVFLRIVWNFQEQLFTQNTSGGCFWNACIHKVIKKSLKTQTIKINNAKTNFKQN